MRSLASFVPWSDTLQRIVWRAAPPPSVLRTRTVAIDLSEESVKYATIDVVKGTPRLALWGKRACGDALLSGTAVGNPEAFVAHLRKIALRTGCSDARVSLGEEAGYLFRVAVAPTRSWEELRAQVEFQLSENIPLSPGEVVFDVTPAAEWEGVLLADVAAYPRKVVETYLELFARAGLQLLSLEIEGAAISRAVLPLGSKGAHFLADIGKTEAAVYVVEDGHLLFSAKLPVGGAHFTAAIQTALGGVDEGQVEELKRTTDLFVETPGDETLAPARAAARDVAEQLANAIRRHLTFWREHEPTAGYPHAPIRKIIAVGGTVCMPGLTRFLSQKVGLPVEVGNVWSNFPSPRKVIPPLSRRDSVQYATAIGLALRDALPALAPPSVWH